MRYLIAFLLLALAACGDSTGPSSGIAGTYQLESINASSLPYEVFGTEILSGTLTIYRDGVFSVSTTTRSDDGTGPVTETESGTGTYNLNDNTLRMVYQDDGEEDFATYADGKVTVDAGVLVAVYRRQ